MLGVVLEVGVHAVAPGRLQGPIDDIPKITVRIDETGALLDVEIEQHPKHTLLIETQRSEPTAPFGDEEYKDGFARGAPGAEWVPPCGRPGSRSVGRSHGRRS